MERTSQFQGCKQRELTREAFESIARRAQLKDRIWEDLNFKNDSCGLSHEEKKAIVNQMAKHRPALALDFDELGLVKDVKIAIDTGDAAPIKAKCRPLAPHLKKPLKEQVDRGSARVSLSPVMDPGHHPLLQCPRRTVDGDFARTTEHSTQ